MSREGGSRQGAGSEPAAGRALSCKGVLESLPRSPSFLLVPTCPGLGCSHLPGQLVPPSCPSGPSSPSACRSQHGPSLASIFNHVPQDLLKPASLTT